MAKMTGKDVVCHLAVDCSVREAGQLEDALSLVKLEAPMRVHAIDIRQLVSRECVDRAQKSHC